MKFFRKKQRWGGEIDPDEIFLDSSNLPKFDKQQFEGTIEKPISKRTIFLFGAFFSLVLILFTSKIFILQIIEGDNYFTQSENNRLENTIIFSERGLVYDRNGLELIANTLSESEDVHAQRNYIAKDGMSHVLGYVGYPLKDKKGNYYEFETVGKDGIEKIFNDELKGENGVKIVEVNALSDKKSEMMINVPVDGDNVTLSIDAELQSFMYNTIRELSGRVGFQGGAGVIMDVKTGEILAMTSFPEYSSDVMSNSENNDKVAEYIFDERHPFLNRITSGLYIPGSIVKPFMALGVLNEGLIDPNKQILSTGSISVQNPYNPELKTVFKDWKAHGWVDMRRALAVSSDVYFYEVGGGYPGQKGLGITKINEYMKMFGFGQITGAEVVGEEAGNVPNPNWKKETFDGEDWTLGNTYHTSIGQYGFQVTPLQAVRATSAVANEGYLLRPTLLKNSKLNNKLPERIDISRTDFRVVKEGMRDAVTEGTAQGLSVSYVKMAGKTGTAELGVSKNYVNSWVIGFFPYENPKYAFTVIMEHGPKTNTVGGLYVMRQTLDWIHIYRPEYLEN
ncbi:hypothetical protein A3I18_02710 [Candidatus Campbellbacteria bacterium RIFCSPLOWO2_02_FULL_35_11]|uniref:Penicillin-binding protein transpeptidase domain-containing protein n=2 Tax=Candidatus Campbelliibacteriota TaxID=1752727 RepID=A0A1F5ELS8_9BACT|nr:MAG: hypothetical protein A3E89_02615 [Candidatus Campbellbacteria bacterium RIFCSPHIGHO2_12_FULL_35_10]OGD70394.1 MAG: hypothetical protein A3I18_02710 [Candidatus Campbellbacteria bacterium RIFCSPLOWO2_02_FULL_35_11]